MHQRFVLYHINPYLISIILSTLYRFKLQAISVFFIIKIKMTEQLESNFRTSFKGESP